MKQSARKLHLQFGWHLLARDVAKWCNTTFFDILDKPALDIFGIVMVIQAEADIAKMNQSHAKG